MISLNGESCFVDSDCLEGHHVEHFIRKIAGKSVVRGGESVSVLVREIHHRNDFRWEYDLAILQKVAVKSFGPHQRDTYVGSVHAFQTISRGASKIRSIIN